MPIQLIPPIQPAVPAVPATPEPPIPPAPQGLRGWAWELERIRHLLEQELPQRDHENELKAAFERGFAEGRSEGFDEGQVASTEDAISALQSLLTWTLSSESSPEWEIFSAEINRRISEL